MSVASNRRTNVSQEEEEAPAPLVIRNRLRIRDLTQVEQIIARNDYEREALELLKRQNYAHAKVFESSFFIRTGLKQDMNRAFTATCWDDFADITEAGSHLLTMVFLISLKIEEVGTKTNIYFRFFNEQFVLSLKDFSMALGFHKRCILDPNVLATTYQCDRSSWWSMIYDEPVNNKNNIISIHNPTLRFLSKWLAMKVLSRSDLRLCSSSEL